VSIYYIFNIFYQPFTRWNKINYDKIRFPTQWPYVSEKKNSPSSAAVTDLSDMKILLDYAQSINLAELIHFFRSLFWFDLGKILFWKSWNGPGSVRLKTVFVAACKIKLISNYRYLVNTQ